MSRTSASAPSTDAGPTEGVARWVGAFALSLATFMSVLDISIANVSIPAIAGDLGVSPNQGTWIVTSFGVATAVSMPLTGWMVQRLGTVRLFALSVLLFTTMSFLCGAAPTIETLVAFRVLQGVVAGPMIPLCQALLLRSFPPDRAGSALSLLALTAFAAPVAGPLLGGWLTDNWSWRWIFHVNVPVGVACAIAVWQIYRPLETATRRAPIDATGLMLLVAWVGSLQLMLDLGKDHDWFGSPVIVALAFCAIACFALFLAWESTDANPIIDLSLFRLRNFWVGTLAISLAYGLFLGNLVLLPLWLLQYMDYSATLAGVVLAPMGVLAIVVMPFVGRYLDRHDPRWMISAAFLTFAFSLWMRSRFSTDADLVSLLLPSFVQGAGSAMFFTPLLAKILSQVPPHRVASASGLSNFLRYTGGAVGTSLLTTAWEWRAVFHRSRLIERLSDGYEPLVQARIALETAGLPAAMQWATIERWVDRQAHTLAVTEMFYGSAVTFVGLVAVIWMGKRAAKRTVPLLGEAT